MIQNGTQTEAPNGAQGAGPGRGSDPEAGSDARADARGALSGIGAFAAVGGGTLDKLAAASVVDEYAPGETVFTMGQADDALYVVLRGEGRLTKAGGERGDISVETVEAGAWVGLIPFALEDGSMGTAALQAIGVMSLLCIDAQSLREAAAEEAALALGLMRLCAKAARSRKGVMDPGARVFRTLLGLVRKTPGGAAIPEMPRHAALAEAAGVTDVEAAGAVADLIARGIAKRDYPGLAILDAAALHRAAYD